MWYPTRTQWRMIWVTALANFALFVIGNRDPVVVLLVLSASIFLGVASLIPALRATRVDPMVALRQE